MKNLCLILIVFLILCMKVYASTWVQVGDNYFIDKDSIEYYINDMGETQYNKKIYWMKTINVNDSYKQIEKDLEKKISYVLTQNIIDITLKKITVKAIIFYDEDGNAIFNHTRKERELNWEAIAPNSNGEYWFELVKSPRYLNKMHKMQIKK